VLAFAQLTWRESLRDIETCLAYFGPKLYHAGIPLKTSAKCQMSARSTDPSDDGHHAATGKAE
jgi:hypothetical protein